MPWLINCAQLDKFRKNQKNVIILDASWHLPNENRSALTEFNEAHIAGARFLDLNVFHDQSSILPNMLIRDEEVISALIRQLGINNDHKIIFYDQSAHYSSCRALWMFKVFGHNPNQLYILDGGFAAWKKYGGKTELGESRVATSKTYTLNYQAHFVRTLMQMKMNLHHPTEQVIDVRHPVRYAGGPEFRANLRSGHIPGSFCFPYMSMFAIDGTWKPLEKIRKQIAGIGVELSYPIVSMCGSGMTAAILNFLLDILGYSHHALYDGSWSEWGSTELYAGEADVAERPVITSLEN